MTMSNLHPGFILIAVGLIALFVPKSLRRPVLAARLGEKENCVFLYWH